MTRTYYVDRTNAPQLTEAQCFKRPGKELLARTVGTSYSFMRVGRFSTIVGPLGMLVAKMYETNGQEVFDCKGTEFEDSSRRDRLSQIARIEAAVKSGPVTPRFREVLDDCAAERQFWAQ